MTVVTTIITAICVVFVAFVMRILKFLEHTVIKGACRALEIVADRMHLWVFCLCFVHPQNRMIAIMAVAFCSTISNTLRLRSIDTPNPSSKSPVSPGITRQDRSRRECYLKEMRFESWFESDQFVGKSDRHWKKVPRSWTVKTLLSVSVLEWSWLWWWRWQEMIYFAFYVVNVTDHMG